LEVNRASEALDAYASSGMFGVHKVNWKKVTTNVMEFAEDQ